MQQVLCQIEEINEGSAKGFDLTDGRAVVVVKKDGQVFVYENLCPHLGIRLEMLEDEFLDMDGTFIQCSTHGALFVIESGECVSGPCQGDQLRVVEHSVDNGRIVLGSK